MANDKDFILKNAVEVGGSTKVTIGDAPASGSVTVGYDLSVAAYDSKSLSVSGQETSPIGVNLSLDGTKMFVLGFTGDDINLYNLSTAFDLSTAVSTSTAFSIGSQDNTPWAFDFKPDGTSIYMVGSQYNTVFQYNCTSAFDIGTASYANKSFNVSTQASSARGLTFKPDGTKMYVLDNGGDDIYQYSLSTAWDVSTASYDSVSFNVTSEATSPYGITFNADGTELFLTAHTTGAVYRYTLTTAYDISTASYSSIFFNISSETTTPTDVFFADSGQKMYINSYGDDTIYQYSTGSTLATATFDTSTGNYFTHTPSADAEYGFSNAGDVQTFQLEVTGNQSVVPYSVAGTATTGSTYATTQGNSAGSIGLFVKPDGTKMYHSDYVSNKVYQHSLSTAWDLSTASYDGSSNDLSVSSQADYPNSIFFKSDGTRLYVAGQTTNRVFEYALSTAWDLSSASYSQQSNNFSGQTSNSGPHTLAFKPDGTKMYLSQTSSRIVYQYSLSTAWDTTSATYDSVSFSYTTFAPGSTYIYFKSDGTKLYLNGSNNGDLYEVDLSTAWDLSTASYNNVSHDYADGFSSNISIKPDGTKFFSITYSPASLMREYSMTASTPITITWDADIEWGGGTAPDSPAANEKDLYTITTDDGGTTYFGVQSGDAFS
jgi:sugar lactone lactonase YvrE